MFRLPRERWSLSFTDIIVSDPFHQPRPRSKQRQKKTLFSFSTIPCVGLQQCCMTLAQLVTAADRAHLSMLFAMLTYKSLYESMSVVWNRIAYQSRRVGVPFFFVFRAFGCAFWCGEVRNRFHKAPFSIKVTSEFFAYFCHFVKVSFCTKHRSILSKSICLAPASNDKRKKKWLSTCRTRL